MIHRQVMGKEGMTLSAIAASAMFAVAFFIGAPAMLTGQMGICLPSPNDWGLSPLSGWLLNVGVMFAVTLTLYFCNKEFTFVPGSDTVLTGMFLILVASNTWTSGMLSTSGIMALANLICLVILFGCYRKRNASQELFAIATILSIGSMIQYAFIFMMPVYLIGATMLKCMNIKAFTGFIMGIIAPYWVGIGLGVIPLEAFRMPTFTNLFEGYATKGGVFFGLINVAVTILITVILALNNGVKQYAGNTQRRLYNMVIDLLGFVAALCLILDFNNMTVYLTTIYMIAAVQLANMFALWDVHRGWLWVVIISGVYLAGFVLMVIY